MSDFNAARTILAEIDRVVTSIGTDDRETVQWMIVKVREALALLRAESAPRPMTGILATLTDEQRAAVLAYDGDETLGDPNDPALSTTTENYGGSDSSHAPEPVAMTGLIDAVKALENGRARWVKRADVLALLSAAPTCTAQTGPAAACVYREPLLRTAATEEHG